METIRARYAAGCDGGRGAVRREAGLTLRGTRYGRHRWYLGDVRADGLDRHCQHVWMSPEDGILSLFPLPGTDIFQFQASIPAEDEHPAEPSLELYRRIFADRAGVPGVALHDAGWAALYRISVCMARAVLDDSTARPHMVMRAAEEGDGARAQRHLTDDFTTGLTIAYLGSALSHRGSGPSRRVDAGDRAPDTRYVDSAGRPVRLFDVFRGPQWTLLAFGATGIRSTGSLHVHPVDDPGGEVRRAYDVTDDELVLVRPDGYVAGRGLAALDVWRRAHDVALAAQA
ncbi:FAD-dependent monooxygenase [Amycolatopsis sp. NPDC051128]|uniref:FAD-dependent monooxygenase n=1 Tax=Amycolatopsis sp. NPDC051128 TaxID=3155412 RepID=UPI003439500F